MQRKIDLCAHLFKLNNSFRKVWSRSERQFQRITLETCRVNLQRRSLFVQMQQFSNNPNHPFKPAMDYPTIILDNLDRFISNVDDQQNVEEGIQKCTQSFQKILQLLNLSQIEYVEVPNILNKMSEMMTKARSIPTLGYELETCICKIMRECQGLSYLISNCDSNNDAVIFSSAKLLGQCLTPENRAYVVEHGLEKVVRGVCGTTRNRLSVEQSRVRTGILEHLFKHSDSTCEEILRFGGLQAVIEDCRRNDVEILRNCAKALTNFSLYGRSREIQKAIIHHNVTLWLFSLAFNDDDIVKYYACLATCILAADRKLLANVLRSGTLELVELFLINHDPAEFIVSNRSHILSQSKNWLSRLTPVLNSTRAEAVDLAAFHFLLEASIGQLEENIEVFREIGAMDVLNKIGSAPSLGAKFAARVLRLFGEKVPAKLSKQAHLWSVNEVQQWVSHIGFSQYRKNFREVGVDGDLLLREVNEKTLTEDLNIKNGLHRLRFLRELKNLKKYIDYGSLDEDDLNGFLRGINAEYSVYTYAMLSAGVRRRLLMNVTEEFLRTECKIENSIHVSQILNAIADTLPARYGQCNRKFSSMSAEEIFSRMSTLIDRKLQPIVTSIKAVNDKLDAMDSSSDDDDDDDLD
ncbi:NAD(+) hydrolase sarm1-like [Planococcus citri]|uniref:NAD(+) hydrolase sarm1-like n=1 Tax=Planococcus citri TaxID=170843 RepID=UPI0031F77C82